MGFFDKFKKKEEPPKQVQVPEFRPPEPKPAPAPAPAKTAVPFNQAPRFVEVKFGTKNAVPFSDPKYRSIFVKAAGSALLKTKSGVMDNAQIETARDVLDTQLSLAISGIEGIGYKDLPTQYREISKKVSDAIADQFDVETIQIFSIAPDENSRKRIEMIDEREKMSDPEYMAKKMAEAQAQAEAALAKLSPEERQRMEEESKARMAMMMSNGPVKTPQSPEEIMKMSQQMKAAADGAPLNKCKSCGTVIVGENKFCPECGAPL